MAYEALQQVIGSKRVMEILNLLVRTGPLHFSEIESELHTSSDVISRGLKTLVSYGLVDRHEESPRSVKYEVTERGVEFHTQAQELETFLADAS